MAGGSRASSSTERPRLADPSGDPAPPATASPAAPEPASPDDEVNLARRRFFRQFAGELIQTAATVAGAAQALQRASAEAAGAILDPAAAALRNDPTAAGQVAVSPPPAVGGPPTGFRTPFREEGGFLLVIDQRKLPDELVEVEVRNAPEAANAIRQMVVRGAPAIGQVAAIGLALSAERATETTAIARRAILRAAAAALRAARPTAVNLGWAVDRMMARFEAVGDLPEDGIAVAAALRDEADAIVTEATTDHGRLAVFGLAALPVREFGPLRILTHCNTGPLACGQFGTALGIVQAARRGGGRDRGTSGRRGPTHSRGSDRAGRDRRPEPRVRRHAGRADHGDRHRGGGHPVAVCRRYGREGGRGQRPACRCASPVC